MKRFLSMALITAMLTAFAPLPAAWAQESGVQTQMAEKSLDQLAAETAAQLTQTYGAVSVQYALIQDGEMLLSGQSGLADLAAGQAPTADTLYGIGSISKIFTTTAVMQLVEAGLVDLDKPVYHYIPEFTMNDPRYKDITVRMLLNHSAGFMGSSVTNAFLYGDNDTINHDVFLAYLASQRLKAEPGAYSVYCNDGFTLAEILVEKVSGKTFTEYLHQKITFPLRLNNTFTPQDTLPEQRLAKYYVANQTNAVPHDTLNIIGTGGIYSTAEDLCRLAQVFMANQVGGEKILQAQTAALTTKPAYNQTLWAEGINDNVSYGLGWDRTKGSAFAAYAIGMVSKGGDTTLSHGSLVVLPQYNMAAAVLTSGGSSVYNQLFAEKLLLNALVQNGDLPESALVSEQEKAVLARMAQLTANPESAYLTPLTPMPEELQQYSGYYGNFGGVMRVDVTADGQLLITIPDVSDYLESYVYAQDNYFTDSTGLIRISFVREENNQIYLQLEGPSILAGLGFSQTSQYNGQKLEPITIPEAVAAAWQERNGKSYYAVSEKYSSQAYQTLLRRTVTLVDQLPGYADGNRIESATQTRAVIQIPGSYGRDLMEHTFMTEKGVEYLYDGSNKFISQDAITDLTTAPVTIPSTGYAQWYTIGDDLQTKTITVTLPPESNVIIYDANGICTHNAYTSGNNTAALPEQGMIVFVGKAGSELKFTIE